MIHLLCTPFCCTCSAHPFCMANNHCLWSMQIYRHKFLPCCCALLKALPNTPHDSSQHVTRVRSLLNQHLTCSPPQHLVLWWQTALITNSRAAAKLLTSLQHWCPELWQCAAPTLWERSCNFTGNGWRHNLCSALSLQKSVGDWEKYLHVPEAPEPGLIPTRSVLFPKTMS